MSQSVDYFTNLCHTLRKTRHLMLRFEVFCLLLEAPFLSFLQVVPHLMNPLLQELVSLKVYEKWSLR